MCSEQPTYLYMATPPNSAAQKGRGTLILPLCCLKLVSGPSLHSDSNLHVPGSELPQPYLTPYWPILTTLMPRPLWLLGPRAGLLLSPHSLSECFLSPFSPSVSICRVPTPLKSLCLAENALHTHGLPGVGSQNHAQASACRCLLGRRVPGCGKPSPGTNHRTEVTRGPDTSPPQGAPGTTSGLRTCPTPQRFVPQAREAWRSCPALSEAPAPGQVQGGWGAQGQPGGCTYWFVCSTALL